MSALRPSRIPTALTVLAAAGLESQARETHYWFPLGGQGSLAEYAAGSVLRSALARLSHEDADLFLAQYAQRLRAAQPALRIGGQSVEMLAQRRVFAVGRNPR